jgi:hypothetical protein
MDPLFNFEIPWQKRAMKRKANFSRAYKCGGRAFK